MAWRAGRHPAPASLSHSLEFLVHWLRHTPHLKASVISPAIFTFISTLFNFHAMRRGTMTVGPGSTSFGEDLRALPRMIGGFLAVLPLSLWRAVRSTMVTREPAGL